MTLSLCFDFPVKSEGEEMWQARQADGNTCSCCFLSLPDAFRMLCLGVIVVAVAACVWRRWSGEAADM
jgi:hypothetical protein